MLPPQPRDELKTAEENDEVPLFSIGLIADTQYADADTGQNYLKTRTRRYRQALKITQNAVKVWNDKTECVAQVRPSLIMHLGDVIDLCNVQKKESVKAMNAVMMEFDKFKPFKPDQLQQSINANTAKQPDAQKPATQQKEEAPKKEQDEKEKHVQQEAEQQVPFGASAKYPFYHNCLGNHEVYNFDRREMQKYQYCAAYDKQLDEYQYYYSFSPFAGFLFIVLDAFALSIHGYEYGGNQHANYKYSMELLNKHNPHENKNIPPTATDQSEFDVERYSAYNGGFGEKQLKWLENELRCATEKGDTKVFIFSHIPLMSNNEKAPYEILAWDYKECLRVIEKYAAVVKAYFAGHEHDGDEKRINGVWHTTLEGAIESGEGVDCFATLYFYQNKFLMKGYGKIKDKECPF